MATIDEAGLEEPVEATDPGAVLRAAYGALGRECSRSGVWTGVRSFRKGTSGKRIFYVPSKKNGGHLVCEGDIEHSLCYQLEWSDQCREYRTQPFTLRFPDDATYTPDFVVRNASGLLEVVECKLKGHLANPTIDGQLKQARHHLERAGIPFSLFTERDIWPEVRAHNLRYLYQHVRPTQSADTLALRFFHAREQATMRDLRAFLTDEREHTKCAEYLLWHGNARFDWDRPLRVGTRITVGARRGN